MAFEFVALLHVEGYKLGSVEPLGVALQFLCSVLIVISVVTVAVRIGSAPHYFKAQAIVGSLVGLAVTITSAALFSVGTPELEHEWNRTRKPTPALFSPGQRMTTWKRTGSRGNTPTKSVSGCRRTRFWRTLRA